MSALKLYYAPQSPFSRKVRAAAIVLGLADRIELEYAEVVPGRPNAGYADSVNPLRKIPALETPDGVLFDSTVICEYLDAIAGGALIPREAPRRWHVLTAHAVAQGMGESVILIRYETWLRPEAVRWPDWITDHWAKIHAGLAWFEANPSLLREPIDLAQLMLGCGLGYIDFRWPDHSWRREAPNVASWFADIDTSDAFCRTRPHAP